MNRISAAAIAVVALIAGVLTAPLAAAAAPTTGSSVSTGIVKTADLSKFQAGNIISDAVFFNRSTMTEAQIQTFLQSKVKSCRSGYTCLKDYYDTSRTVTADAMCGKYSGGTRERASRIIYKVAQACGINPQVLLVMLQKEQGLILSNAPSAYNYRAAMGQGCPDTAACDTRYYGFFNQVYGGAWQMKRYANPAGTSKFFTWYAPGKTWNILYHPKSSCGKSAVYIQNQATANLYYYTPYRPNAAAIRAGYGTGDACSSYGNRNFYQFFTDWFGSTQAVVAAPAAFPVTGAIATEWKRRGGATGALGNPLAAVQTVTDPNGNGLAQKFTGGWIHSSDAGTFSSLTPIMVAYSAAGWLRGDLGWPVAQATCTSGTCTQPFAGGIISYTGSGAATSTMNVSAAAISAEYAAQGGAKGPLGEPISSVQVVSHSKGSGLARKYDGGWIHSSKAGTFATLADAMTVYSAAGWVRGAFGWPTSDDKAVSGTGGKGRSQTFQGGAIHSSTRGIFASPARIATAHTAAGGVGGALGWPTDALLCTGTACVQRFVGGIVSYVGSDAATASVGVDAAAINKAAAQQISITGALGSSQLAQLVADPNGSGLAKKYARGWIYSSGFGTFVSSNTVMAAYSATGWLRGGLGWPTGAETCSATLCSQSFDGGMIVYSNGKPAVAILDAGPDELAAVRAGSTTGLGKAAAAVQTVADPNGNGLARKYAQGWVHASARGAFASSAKIMTAYSAAGWLRGFLGWPRAAEQTVTDPNGNGTAQAFDGGWIHSSAAGSYASSTTVMTAYSAAGWLRGELGWPIGPETCTGKACVQPFDGGVIEYIKGKAATARVGVTAEAIATAAAEQTAVTTSLGKPQVAVQVVADLNGSGLAQRFADGWVHSSDRGTFVSSMTVMTAYSKAGWLRGKLGWPTGVEKCSGSTCSQTFEGGTVSYAKGKPATVKLK
ncbi:LGFP repeat-containing protein [Microbacterium sp. NPDC056003]|uniref:LGFP repeat-containing protein n=1 Tax=Microbacterium sp. NPDC056003 TaxID=3345676 RepID=UPI0035D5BE0C